MATVILFGGVTTDKLPMHGKHVVLPHIHILVQELQFNLLSHRHRRHERGGALLGRRMGRGGKD